MAKYNGWTNWETWKTNLELLDGEEPTNFDDEILDCYEDGKWDKEALESVSERYAEYLEDIVDNYLELENQNNFIESVVNAFLEEVNFQEIAENIIDDYKETLI